MLFYNMVISKIVDFFILKHYNIMTFYIDKTYKLGDFFENFNTNIFLFQLYLHTIQRFESLRREFR